jgi:hypothetical protein
MFRKIKHFDPNVPTYKKHLESYKWTFLFLYDQLFGISSSSKNSSGKVLKKLEGKTQISSKYAKLHSRNVEKLLEDNKDFTYSEPLTLPEISAEDFNKDIFTAWKEKINTPLVIRNYLKDAPVLDLLSRENLCENYGDVEIRCTTDVEESKGESRAGQNLSTISACLRDFIESPQFENFYINNFAGVLSDDDFLKFCKGNELNEVQGKTNILTQWFISRSEGKGSTLHCATADNMFLNIKGRKQWHFIHPSYTPIMQATLSKHGTFAVSEMFEPLESDFFENLTKSYPHIKNVPVYKVELEEGDLLFNPPWWWHSVRNLDTFTIGCATRYWEKKYSLIASPTLSTGQLVEFIKAPKKSVSYLAIKSLLNKKNASGLIDSIFSGETKEIDNNQSNVTKSQIKTS